MEERAYAPLIESVFLRHKLSNWTRRANQTFFKRGVYNFRRKLPLALIVLYLLYFAQVFGLAWVLNLFTQQKSAVVLLLL